ncbi:MAG: GxxExxY protein [Paludibacter sp.]|jgi:GxxExxY protein|nr:GxxExxY protein [Paludibacter sp.]MBP7612749.1 GxxExxY protein [Paludibacter sp.]
MEEQENLISKELVDIILKHFYRIYNDLGYGFLERVYQNALYFALLDEGLKCEAEKPIKVYFDGRVVGDYRADILVEDCVILELKAVDEFNPAFDSQLINYLKATDIEVGYVLNFGKKPKYSRKVYSNSRKFH